MSKINLIIFYILILLLKFNIYSQTISNQNSNDNMLFLPTANNLDKTLKDKKHKMYLSEDFSICYIDNIDKDYYLRFNLYKDEMEFMKNGKIYYLKKNNGKTIYFKNLNKRYQILSLNNKLQYFEIFEIEGQNKLICKQSVKYIKAKPAASSYQKAIEADLKRENDIYYLKNKEEITKIPTKKKKFYLLFNDKSSDIKTYCKKNKINIKEKDDLIKVIGYYNTL